MSSFGRRLWLCVCIDLANTRALRSQAAHSEWPRCPSDPWVGPSMCEGLLLVQLHPVFRNFCFFCVHCVIVRVDLRVRVPSNWRFLAKVCSRHDLEVSLLSSTSSTSSTKCVHVLGSDGIHHNGGCGACGCLCLHRSGAGGFDAAASATWNVASLNPSLSIPKKTALF